MKNVRILNVWVVSFVVSFALNSFAEETQKEKLETSINEATDETKKVLRRADDKICEMVNGKMKCVGRKIMHKVKNVSDKVETKAKEIKNKVD